MDYFLFSLMGFILGGTMFSYHLPLIFKKVNIVTDSPDHNPGTANAMKYGGVAVGFLCLLCDVAKGFLPVFLARKELDINNIFFSFVMLAPVLGHAFAPLYKFKGGKAIATTFGVLLALLPQVKISIILIVLYIAFSTILKVNPHERRTVVTFALFALLSTVYCVYYGNLSLILGVLTISAVVAYKNYIG
ncbi:MAG: glycerol-3-phosphate acyltransferase [Oscillospiraceae bacterium]